MNKLKIRSFCCPTSDIGTHAIRVDTREFSDERLGIEFTTQRPISADALADSFKGLSALYRREVVLVADKDFLEGSEFILYVTKIETKCIYTELAAFVGASLPAVQMMDYAVTIDSFQQRLRSLILHFSSGRMLAAHQAFERPVTLMDAKDLCKVIKAAGGGGIKIDRTVVTSPKECTIVESFEFSAPQIDAALNDATAFIEEISQKEDADFVMVSLYFDRLNRVNVANSSRSPERGTIEIISKKSLPVRWVSELDDMRVKSIGANLFGLIFNVDVKVDYVRGQPVAYRVLKLHEWDAQEPEPDPELPA